MEKTKLFEKRQDTLIIYLPKELDHDMASEIQKETETLFVSRKIRNVIFDYANTNFMDSSGIGLIMGRYRQVRYLKGNVYIVGVNEKVARILDISGLYRVARKCENVEGALEEIEIDK